MSETRETLDSSKLVQLLEQQRTLYLQLRHLADRQKALVIQEDPQPLLALLSQRQHLVDALAELNKQLAPYRREWTQVYRRLDEPSRRRASRLLEEANALLGTILQNDRKDTATLSARRQHMAARLAAVDTGSRARHAYCSASADRRESATDARV